jgi:hypothetical protein
MYKVLSLAVAAVAVGLPGPLLFAGGKNFKPLFPWVRWVFVSRGPVSTWVPFFVIQGHSGGGFCSGTRCSYRFSRGQVLASGLGFGSWVFSPGAQFLGEGASFATWFCRDFSGILYILVGRQGVVRESLLKIWCCAVST